MTDRVFCCVRGCTRFSYAETCVKRWGTANVVFICGKHWRRLTKAERLVWSRLRRLAKKIGWESLEARHDRVWEALRRRCAL